MSIGKNVFVNGFFTLSIGLYQFVINRYFVDALGVDTLGLMRLFTQLLGYLNLADLGIASASAYALYKPLAEKDYERVGIIMNTMRNFYTRVAIFVLILGFPFMISLGYITNNNSLPVSVYVAWLLYVVNLSINYLFARYSVLFTADQQFSYVRIVQGVGKLVSCTLQLIAIVFVQSFTLFCLAMLIENLFSAVIYIKRYRDNYRYIPEMQEKDKGILADIKNLFWHRIATIIVFNTDYLVLSKFTSLKVVGQYSTYLIVTQMVMMIVNIIVPAISPAIGAFIATSSKRDVYKQWQQYNVLFFYIAGGASLMCVFLIQPFIALWMGEHFLLSTVTMCLIIANMYMTIARQATATFKANAGFFDDIYVPIGEALTNLVMSLILVQYIGVNGVVIGTVLSNLIFVHVIQPVLVFNRCYDLSLKHYLSDTAKVLFPTCIGGLLSWGGVVALGIDWVGVTWFDFVLNTTKIFVICAISLSVCFYLNKDFRFVIGKLQHKFTSRVPPVSE